MRVLYIILTTLCALGASLALIIFLVNAHPLVGIDRQIHQNEMNQSCFEALWINLILIIQFGIQHSLMARDYFKNRLTRYIPPQMERNTYVFMTGISLLLILFFWQAMPQSIWSVRHVSIQIFIWMLFISGWALSIWAVISIDLFELIGIKQLNPPNNTDNKLIQSGIHSYIRHPIYTGLIIAFWATPHMSMGHLLFAITMTAYIRVGIYFEEQGLIQRFGDDYLDYRDRVPMLFPSIF
jgi:methanethiol S-methyltransferase